MSFAPPPPPRQLHRATVRDALTVVGIVAVLLLAFFGDSVRRSGEEMHPGWERTLVLAVGHPAGWVTDTLGLAKVGRRLTAWARPGDGTGDSAAGGFASDSEVVNGATGVVPVTPDAFDPAELGARPRPPRPLKTVLVTGDSMSMPLDAQVARALAGAGAVRTVRDPHLGTGISECLHGLHQ